LTRADAESIDNNRGRTGRFSCHTDFRLTALSPFDIGARSEWRVFR
jgi:hypothetical protein